MFSGAAHAESAPLSPSTIADAAESAGLPCVPAVAVAEAESDGVPDAVGEVREEGTWQIDLRDYWPGLRSLGNPNDVQVNARMAEAVYDAGGWDMWSTWNSGAYRQYLPLAHRACGKHDAGVTKVAEHAPRHARRTYTVRAGDELHLIAARLGVTTEALWTANRAEVPNADLIHPGQVLTLP
jgi:nucleoid-associated protein YgaU